MTIYVPDDLATEVRAELGDANISAICQAALRAELDRAKARAEVTKEGFERVEVYDENRGHDVAFQGREIGSANYHDQIAYLTANGAIAVYDSHDQRLHVYDGYGAFAEDHQPDGLLASVAEALGENYVEELDI